MGVGVVTAGVVVVDIAAGAVVSAEKPCDSQKLQ